jgi:tRNA-dihydrouridine synthase
MGEVKAKARIPIIGNGDLTTAEKAHEYLRKYGVDAVLIGRGALRNPFIFEQAEALWKGETPAPITADRFLKMLKIQRVLLSETFKDPKGVLLHARKFLSWYSAGYPGASEFRKTVFATQDEAVLWQYAHDFYERAMSSRDLSFLQEEFLMGGHG